VFSQHVEKAMAELSHEPPPARGAKHGATAPGPKGGSGSSKVAAE